jgi:hypothetical protein
MGRIGNIDLDRFKSYIDSHPRDFSQDDGRRVVDVEGGIVRIDGFFSVVETAKRQGLITATAPVNYLRFSGVNPPELRDRAILICNSTRVYDIDGTDAAALSRAEIEGRDQLREVVKACKHLLPGFENSFLVDTSAYIGVRETRRIQGRSTLTYPDIRDGKRHADSVAVMTSVDYGTAELHGADFGHEGSAADEWARKLSLKLMRFEFPMSCMLPQRVENLIVAGRCASVSHDVDKFSRNMAPTGLAGQAAGVMAAVMANDVNPDWHNPPIQRIQQLLEQQGVLVRLPEGSPHSNIEKHALMA